MSSRSRARVTRRADGASPPAGSTVAIGQRNEDRAVAALASAGYRVVERNVRLRIGELDAVAYDGDTLVFVEVRSRRDHQFGGGLAAVPHSKQRQVARAAAVYLTLRRPVFRACRFDVVAITGDELVIVRDAFRITW